MSPPMGERKRAKKPKTRTGCITCKLRRVKCDEGKPACNKCLKFGVECAGYQAPDPAEVEEKGQGRHVFRIAPRDSASKKAPNPLIDPLAFTSPFHDPGRNRYFLFFQEQTIAELSGAFEEGLFSTVALQGCYSEPALMDLVSAIGAIHKSSRQASKGSEASLHKRQALLSYGQALAGIQRLTKNPTSHSARLVLIAALLIFCFENLQGHSTTATMHLQSALRLLRKQLAENADRYRHTAGISPTADIEDSIIASYVRLDNGIYSCLKVKLGEASLTNDVYGILRLNYAEDQVVPQVFVTVHEARNYLEALQFHSLPILLKEFHARLKGFSVSIGLKSTQAYILALHGFEAWNKAFAPLYRRVMTPSSDGKRNPEWRGASMMRARGMNCILAIQTLLPVLCNPIVCGPDVDGNDLTQNCKEVLSHTRSICEDPEFRRDFVLDCGILPGLFMVIVAYVDNKINLEALELMKSLRPRREGVWDSADLVVAGEAYLQNRENWCRCKDVD